MLKKTNVTENRIFTTKQLVIIAMLAALSYVLQLLHLPFKYLGFLEFEFSDIPAIVAGFVYGPLVGIMIEMIKNLIKGITATTTGGVGEIANFIISVAYIYPTCYLFRKLKGRGKYSVPFITGVISMSVVGILMNYFLMIPLQAKVYHLEIETIVGWATATIPAINDLFTLVILGITPYNIAKGLAISIIGFFCYKYLKNFMTEQ
ncbi:ECF transporter S component [Anaeromicropila populeti]|uniref:Riboflavin transporter n=1 Tax=Anaeromicropila populeti TaxID=37658 RepID=A0A1I6J3C9_9FIRM|nr:ECF transporter S component [Anaeromicropila populeti]SFR73524.1 Riboflavin transporter FmnP [Anaeromicropila populeti]